MEPYFIIDPKHPGNYYALFYLLAFLVGFVLLIVDGRKRKFPTIPWMMVIATAFLFFMVGCRMIAFSKEEWEHVFRFEAIPYSTGRSVLGGILLSVPGILLAKKCLKFQYTIMDSFALVLPIALVVQRFGCFLAGCCYGTPTNLPLGIQYGKDSHAFSQHIIDGLLSAESSHSLPIHPVQLYEVLCCVVITLLLVRLRKIIKVPGNFFLTSIGLYGAFRFILEFVRASRSRSFGGETFLHLNYVQWGILLIVPLLVLLICNRERRFRNYEPVASTNDQDFFRPAFYFLLIINLFLFVSTWLDRLEVASFNIVLVPMLVLLTWYLFSWVTVPRYRLISLALPVISLLLMSQTLPDSTRSSYNTLSMGIMGGGSDLIYGDDYTDSCNDSGMRTSYSNSYSSYAFGYAHTQQRGSRITTFGLNWFKGKHSESTYSGTINGFQEGDYHFSTFAFNPYVHVNQQKFGLGVGFNLGEFTRIVPVNNGDPSTVKQYNFFPSFKIRAGDLSKAFVEYKFTDQFPSGFPALSHQFIVGIGTSRRDHVWRGGGIRIGTASNAGFFVSTSSAIGETVIFTAFFGGFGGMFNPYDFTHSSMGSLSLHIKLGKEKKLP